MSEIKDYNYFYGLINENLYVITPTILGVSGGIAFGLPGAVLGLSVNILDRGLNYFIQTKNNYLTKIFIGFNFGYAIYPSYILGSIFATCGVITPIENTVATLNQYNIMQFLISTRVLGSEFGIKGLLLGGSTAVADLLLIYLNITKKHYLVYSFTGLVTTNLILGKSLIANSIGLALGLVISDHEDYIHFTFKPHHLSKELYLTYSKIIESDKLTHHISNHIELLLISQVILQQLLNNNFKFQQEIIYNFEHMDETASNLLERFKIIVKNFLLSLAISSAFELISVMVNNYFSTVLYLEIDNNLKEALFSNEIALKLYLDQDIAILIDNIKADGKVISYGGSKLISDAVSKTTKGICGFSKLIITSPDILIYSITYHQFTKYISKIFASRGSALESQIKNYESLISTHLKYYIQNIKPINEREGTNYSKLQLSELYDKLFIYELERDQISIIFNIWTDFVSVLDFVYSYYLVGIKINAGKINFNDRISIHQSSRQVSGLLSWENKKSAEIEDIYRSLDRVNSFINKILTNNSANANHICKDNIKRSVFNDISVQDKLVLSNIRITIKDQLLVRTEYLELHYGKIYVLSAPSGSGKSSLASKIAGVSQYNLICGEGDIYYPINSKIMMIPQNDYFPLNITLQEMIFYPDSFNEFKAYQIQALLEKTKMSHYMLNQTENWANVLSGGQKKKLLILSAIIKKPNVLILDETFNGLDKESINTIQSLIKFCLRKSLIISIDHNFNEDNYLNFYEGMLTISNKLLQVKHNMYKNSQNDILDQYQDSSSSDGEVSPFLELEICS